MRITHYLYNAFIIEAENKKIAIDPGAMFFYFLRFTTLIPKSEWRSITHIFVTHGDPDHYWHIDRIAKASNAPVVCNKSMLKEKNGQKQLLGPRSKGLSFTLHLKDVRTVSVDETINVDGMEITGIKTTHGELVLRFGPLSKTIKPGPDERVGWGAIGFEITLGNKKVVNLGDTLLHEKEWQTITSPDILMIPIGGKSIHNTMDEKEALRAVKVINPKHVIPCHYNCPAFFTKKYNPADDSRFKRDVEETGVKCTVLGKGESLKI
jgi:L-ascorbate metabolism protein UlaG (beta-lactamase superfamily)